METQKSWWARLKATKGAHWSRLFFLTIIAVFVGHSLQQTDVWQDLQLALHGKLMAFGPRSPDPIHTAMVMIGDDEYWRGELAGRRKLKRDYIANIIRSIAKRNPAAIVVDIDFIVPDQGNQQTLDTHPYVNETRILIDTVADVAQNTFVVISKSLRCGPETTDSSENQARSYELASAVYQHESNDPPEWESPSIDYGYIELNEDLRRLPLRLPIQQGGSIPSLSLASTRVLAPHLAEKFGSGDHLTFPYSSFINENKFTVFSATEILSDSIPSGPLNPLNAKIVIIGGSWHDRGHGLGQLVDTHRTPVGVMPGTLLHANYIESILSQRSTQPLPNWVVISIEVSLALALAILLLLARSALVKIIIVLFACLAFLAMNYFVFQNLGFYSDFLIPTVLIAIHAFFEQLLASWGKFLVFAALLAGVGGLNELNKTKPTKDCRVAAIAGVAKVDIDAPDDAESNRLVSPDSLSNLKQLASPEPKEKKQRELKPSQERKQYVQTPRRRVKNRDSKTNELLERQSDNAITLGYEFETHRVSLAQVELSPSTRSTNRGRQSGAFKDTLSVISRNRGINVLIASNSKASPIRAYRKVAIIEFKGDLGKLLKKRFYEQLTEYKRSTNESPEVVEVHAYSLPLALEEARRLGAGVLVVGEAITVDAQMECDMANGFEGTLEVISTNDQTIIHRSFDRVAPSTSCGPKFLSKFLSSKARLNRFSSEIENELFPATSEFVNFEILGKGMKTEYRELFRTSDKYLKNNSLDKACIGWRDIFNQYESVRRQAQISFNLGLCYEAIDDVNNALRMYKLASIAGISSKELEQKIASSLKRVAENRDHQ